MTEPPIPGIFSTETETAARDHDWEMLVLGTIGAAAGVGILIGLVWLLSLLAHAVTGG